MNNKNTDQKEKVSVIIPAYNRESFINQTLDSVIQQTYTNTEIIVVDDGCTDRTRTILEEYGTQITLLEHPGRINKGQSAAINLGLEKASGKYICVLDSDDYWESNKIEKQVLFLESNPDVGLVYGNGTAVDEQSNHLYDIYSDRHREENMPGTVLLDCYFLVPNNAMIRADIFKKTGFFDENLRSAQDHDMAIRISEVTKLAYIPDKIFHYRRHAASISRKHTELRWRNGFIILDKAIKRYPYPRKTIRKRKAVLNFRLFQCALNAGNIFRGFPYLIKAGLYDPLRALKVLAGREHTGGLH